MGKKKGKGKSGQSGGDEGTSGQQPSSQEQPQQQQPQRQQPPVQQQPQRQQPPIQQQPQQPVPQQPIQQQPAQRQPQSQQQREPPRQHEHGISLQYGGESQQYEQHGRGGGRGGRGDGRGGGRGRGDGRGGDGQQQMQQPGYDTQGQRGRGGGRGFGRGGGRGMEQPSAPPSYPPSFTPSQPSLIPSHQPIQFMQQQPQQIQFEQGPRVVVRQRPPFVQQPIYGGPRQPQQPHPQQFPPIAQQTRPWGPPQQQQPLQQQPSPVPTAQLESMRFSQPTSPVSTPISTPSVSSYGSPPQSREMTPDITSGGNSQRGGRQQRGKGGQGRQQPQRSDQPPTSQQGAASRQPQQPAKGLPSQGQPVKKEIGAGDAPHLGPGGEKLIAIKHGGGSVPLIEPQEKLGIRKGGTLKRARKIDLITNHFPLSLGKITRAIHYDVDISPDKPKKLFRAVMEAFRRAHYGRNYPAFDGSKNLYSAVKLCENDLSGSVKVVEDDREREFKVTIKPVATIDLSILNNYFQSIEKQHIGDKPMQALQCLDVILRMGPSLHCIQAGRSFFNEPGKTIRLGDGTELYNGFYQSAILGWKPFLNLDVAHKAFPMAMPVIDFVYELNDRLDPSRYLDRWVEEALQKHIRNLKVQYEIPNIPGSKRVHRVNNTDQPPNRVTFKDDKGNTYTVEQYFAKEKRYKIRYPNWPTLWVGSRQRENKILVPMELCTILKGQVVNKKMTETQTRNMIKEAATSATVRLDKIQRSMASAKYNESPSVKEFGIHVSDQPEKIHARVLNPPTLEYNQKQIVRVSRGVWNGKIFQSGASISSWTIISLDGRTDNRKLDELERCLISSGRKCGVNIPEATRDRGRDFSIIREDSRNPERTKKDLINYLNSTKYDLTVVVVPDFSKTAYATVKQVAEISVGRLTQCIRSKTLMRLSQSTTDNIILKINAKLNGVNHILSNEFQPSCFQTPIVVMGADVTHPSPDSQNIPSVAAVTCSYDMHGFKYIFSWRLQEPRLEIIKDLKAIVMEQLKYFRERNKCAPQKIIFFRDGVSDGQFREVLSSELRSIRNACMELNQNYKPKITFLVVQKRHHTRLFPMNPRDSEDRNCNVPAGTCVDTVITTPKNFDFYLVSHASIQGVAKPTKYFPLWDDADMTEDEIQELTYYLCHLFARCNRSVSYPTPTYYAHLAAARAKVYVETEREIDLSNLDRLQNRLQVQQSIIRGLPMYFV